MRKIIPSSVLIIFVAVALSVVVAVASYDEPKPDLPVSNQANDLRVDESGSAMQTNVPGGQLQQGSAPVNSGASSDQTPQQAQPNYCAEGEVPVVDGCVAR